MKKYFIVLTIVIVVGVLSFTCQIGKANANTDKEFSENVYAFEEPYLGSVIEPEEREESTIYVPADVTDVHEAEFTIGKWGYTYCAGENNISIMEAEAGDDILNSGLSSKGKEKEEISERILSWDEAQDYFGDDTLRWLNNEYLNSCAGDISFILSDDDIAIAEYSTQTSKVKIYVFTVCGQDDKCFEFGRNYSSELYNVHQIEEGYIWQCFSYKGYDGTEYTSAVLPDNNMVCEIVFEKCDEQFIYNTLASY